jgi:hypothetical protein
LIRINTQANAWSDNFYMEWQSVATAPFDRDLELAVIDRDDPHALVFPCRRVLSGRMSGWIRSGTQERIEVHPTHWREWKGRVTAASSRPEP